MDDLEKNIQKIVNVYKRQKHDPPKVLLRLERLGIENKVIANAIGISTQKVSKAVSGIEELSDNKIMLLEDLYESATTMYKKGIEEADAELEEKKKLKAEKKAEAAQRKREKELEKNAPQLNRPPPL